MSGHFIWNLWNEFKILFIIYDCFKWDFIALKVHIFSIEKNYKVA